MPPSAPVAGGREKGREKRKRGQWSGKGDRVELTRLCFGKTAREVA